MGDSHHGGESRCQKVMSVRSNRLYVNADFSVSIPNDADSDGPRKTGVDVAARCYKNPKGPLNCVMHRVNGYGGHRRRGKRS